MLECGFESRLRLKVSGFSVWHFLELIRVFLQVLWFPPLPHWLIILAKNSIRSNSWAVPSYRVAHDMSHVKSARCIAHDLHPIAPWAYVLEKFAAQWDCKKISNCPFQSNYYYHYYYYYYYYYYHYYKICLAGEGCEPCESPDLNFRNVVVQWSSFTCPSKMAQ